MQEILQFDFVTNFLFKGGFTVKPEKHLLTTELEKLLPQSIILPTRVSLKRHLLLILCP